MRKCIFSLLGISLLLVSCQRPLPQNSLQYDHIYGKVKSVKKTCYKAVEKFGEVQKMGLIDELTPNGISDPAPIEIAEYDNLGFLTSYTRYEEPGKIQRKYTYIMDGRRLAERSYYGPLGKLQYHNKFYPDERGYNIKGETYTEDGNLSSTGISTVDENGFEVEYRGFDLEGNTTCRIVTEYDDAKVLSQTSYYEFSTYKTVNKYRKGKLTESTITTSDADTDVASYTTNIEYNEFEQPVTAQEFSPNRFEEYTYSYEYDDHNNWIKRITRKDCKPLCIEEREIIYY